MSVHGLEFRTGQRSPHLPATGFGARLEIEAREDAQRAARRAATARRSPEQRLRSSESESAAAMEWARRVGFDVRLQSFAALAAIELRSQLGEGAVTRQAVMDRLRARRPWLFEAAAAAERSST